jgi:hypothetical protein
VQFDHSRGYLPWLVVDSSHAAEIGQRAAHYIQTWNGFKAVGVRHRRRLEQLRLLG